MFWHRIFRKLITTVALSAACALALGVQAAQLTVTLEPFKKNLRQGVVYLVPQFSLEPPNPIPTITISQKDRVFEPFISVTQVGGKVTFPNRDEFSHHVYSFSKAKKFELPLYTSELVPEVAFDTSGTIILGCNVHDWMLAYLLVVDTPFYAIPQTDRIEFTDLPKGEYELFYWHPSIVNRVIQHSEIIVMSQDQSLTLTIDRKIKKIKHPKPKKKKKYKRL